uniref:DUF86 domain-containing protein n=1 Tax=Dictyoglomus thermophilum TaxID=14 RepID=A0A7C3RRD1_DICTH
MLTSLLKRRQFFIGDLALVDRELILRKLSEIEEHLQELEEFKDISIENYEKDWKIQRIVERTLQILIEICIDIANHIISDEKWRVPSSYSETFKILYENRVIDSALFKNLEKMAKFRNIIVHNYDKISPEVMVNILRKELIDFLKFKDSIILWLSNK